jgi:tetratricopeptide (TPR) repeat protein
MKKEDAINNLKTAEDEKNSGDELTGVIADFTKALKTNPDSAVLYNERGRAHRDREDYTAAIADYTKAIRLNPEYANAFCGRGQAYYHNDDYTKAIKDLNKAIQLDSEYVIAYFLRGAAYSEQGDYSSAEKDINKSIELAPDAPAYVFHERGFVFIMRKKYDAAVSDFSAAIDLYGTEDDCEARELAILYNYRGLAWSYLGNKANALKDYEEAIRLDPHEKQYEENRDDEIAAEIGEGQIIQNGKEKKEMRKNLLKTGRGTV